MGREQLTVGMIYRKGDGATTNVLERNSAENITICNGTTIPADAGSGYAVGCVFTKTDATLGGQSKWINGGSTTSCAFRSTGETNGHGVYRAGEHTTAGGDATEVITVQGIRGTSDMAILSHQVSNDTDDFLSQIVTDNTITTVASADPSTAHAYGWAVLRQGCIPEWDIFAAGTIVSVGGDASEAITVTGALAPDLALFCHSATDDSDTIAKGILTANTLTLTVSADPGATHGYHYAVLRPRGSFVPSHYIAYAGVHTTVGGAAAEAITVTGALATDVPIVYYAATDDTDTIKKSVMTADTLTVTLSADPSTTHKLAYMILRAY